MRVTEHRIFTIPDPSWESRSKRWNEIIADNPLYTESTVDRTQRCVERDKKPPQRRDLVHGK